MKYVKILVLIGILALLGCAKTKTYYLDNPEGRWVQQAEYSQGLVHRNGDYMFWVKDGEGCRNMFFDAHRLIWIYDSNEVPRIIYRPYERSTVYLP
jgi:hypothetical protein